MSVRIPREAYRWEGLSDVSDFSLYALPTRAREQMEAEMVNPQAPNSGVGRSVGLSEQNSLECHWLGCRSPVFCRTEVNEKDCKTQGPQSGNIHVLVHVTTNRILLAHTNDRHSSFSSS